VTLFKSPVNVVVTGCAALSVWIGLQLWGRDWMAWVFILGIPVSCLAVIWLFSRFKARRRKP